MVTDGLPPPPDAAWRNFRAVAVGCPVGWLLAVGMYAAMEAGWFVGPDRRPRPEVLVGATCLYTMLPAYLYPWGLHREGTRLVQSLVAVAFVTGFVLVLMVLLSSGVKRV